MANIRKNTVIICSDGAIRGGYIAGAFFALKRFYPDFWNTVTDFTASSASIGGIFYEMAYGDEALGKKLWTEDFSDPNLINIRNILHGKSMYDIDYLVDTIFKKNNPCDSDLIAKSRYGYYFPLIDYDTGKTVIFNNRIEKRDENNSGVEYKIFNPKLVYKYIKAATAAPILYDKYIEIEGSNYIDAGFRVPYFTDDELFKNHKKIIISTKGRLSAGSKAFYQFSGTLYEKMGFLVRANLKKSYYREIVRKPDAYRYFEDKLDKLGSESDTLYIHPSMKLGGRFDNSSETLIGNFEAGEKDIVEKQEEILRFIDL